MKKFTSRKFILTLLTNIIAIANMFVNNDNANVQLVSIIVLAVANVIYNTIEGTIDAKAVLTAIIKETENKEEE